MGSSSPFVFLDKLRSTRTRIAKPKTASPSVSSSFASHQPETDQSSRDFSNYLGDSHPLRIIFVGHNPSEKSWACSAPYAHPTNKFWRLLKEAKLAPEDLCKAESFALLPKAVGIGFIDLFVASGSDASKIGPGAEKRSDWRVDFLSRLRAGTKGIPPLVLCCVSKIVASKLLGGWKGEYGHIGNGKDWGLDAAENSEIWVLPSTSGRAVLSWEQRLMPFQDLRAHFPGEWEKREQVPE